jgi:hypothetical protein
MPVIPAALFHRRLPSLPHRSLFLPRIEELGYFLGTLGLLRVFFPSPYKRQEAVDGVVGLGAVENDLAECP